MNIGPKIYQKYSVIDKGVKVLHVMQQKTLCGFLLSALLFYSKIMTALKNNGFRLSSYKPCVTKKLVNGKMMTVVWTVNDLKVSHKDPFEVTKFATYLSSIYGNKLKLQREKVHYYLGIYLDNSDPGVVKVSMIKYL